MIGLEIRNIHKAFGEKRALEGVSFTIEQGQTVALLGPSGCGKSTLLGIIAGLTQADQGDIYWQGKDIRNTPAHQRGFGLMFQDFALFPHRNVYGNVAFGLQMAHLPPEQIKARVAEVLELVGLPGFEGRDVNTLSGGESQRVALARALAPRPRLLMLDEPLGSLDRNLRQRLALDLRQILARSRQTALYVTHDQEEAFVIAQRVVIMNQGKVEQTGAPEELYRRPGCEFVARFLGLNNLLPGEVRLSASGPQVQTPIGVFPAPGAAIGKCLALIRPEGVLAFSNQLSAISDQRLAESGQITGVLVESTFRGGQRQIEVAVEGFQLSFIILSSKSLPAPGEIITLTFDPRDTLQIIQPSACGS